MRVMNSCEVMILAFSQNLGKWRRVSTFKKNVVAGVAGGLDRVGRRMSKPGELLVLTRTFPLKVIL
jgi:hypothetical protein